MIVFPLQNFVKFVPPGRTPRPDWLPSVPSRRPFTILAAVRDFQRGGDRKDATATTQRSPRRKPDRNEQEDAEGTEFCPRISQMSADKKQNNW
jgi:hypothetical protein